MKLAISSYSFHRFGWGPEGEQKPSLTRMIERCAELGVDGIELLGQHIDGATLTDLHALKSAAGRNGIAIVAISAHHNFVTPDPTERLGQIDIVTRWVDVAHEVGAFAVRVFGGRWHTLPKFQDFMAARGEEPPLPGYTIDDGFRWSAEAFRIASYYAGQRGVTLALENHWGLTGSAAGVQRILDDTGSPWLKVVLDTGNFNYSPDPYAEMARLLPSVVMVHAKTYTGGGMFYTPDLDYRRIGRLLRDAGFHGYVSVEFEGQAHPDDGLPESVAMLRDAFADL